MKTWILAIACVVGCSSGKDKTEAPPATPGPAAIAPATPPPPPAADPACTEQTAKLEAWMKDLAAEGHRSLAPSKIQLAKLDNTDIGSTPSDRTATVVVSDAVEIEGKSIVSTKGVAKAEIAKQVETYVKAMPAKG